MPLPQMKTQRMKGPEGLVCVCRTLHSLTGPSLIAQEGSGDPSEG